MKAKLHSLVRGIALVTVMLCPPIGIILVALYSLVEEKPDVV